MIHTTLKLLSITIVTTLLFSNFSAFADDCNVQTFLEKSTTDATEQLLQLDQPVDVTQVACQRFCMGLSSTDITSAPTSSTCMQNLSGLQSRNVTLYAQNQSITTLSSAVSTAGSSSMGASNPTVGGTASPPPSTKNTIQSTVRQATESKPLNTPESNTNSQNVTSQSNQQQTPKSSVRWL